MELPKAIFCWSGGKDSAYALHKVLIEKLFEVKYLLTTISEKTRRISMHGVLEELVDAQADSLGIPLLKVYVGEGTNEEYEMKMEEVLTSVKSEGISHVIFGDIFLEDLRAYREANLTKVRMKAEFPIWHLDTKWLVNDFVSKGFKTITCCVNNTALSEEWVGKEIDQEFIEELPASVDPCGENGEYHSFCYDGPIFSSPILFEKGQLVFKTYAIQKDEQTNSGSIGFWFCDLVPYC